MQCCLMTIKEKYVAWRLEHQLHFVVRVGVDLHLHRVHVLVLCNFGLNNKFIIDLLTEGNLTCSSLVAYAPHLE